MEALPLAESVDVKASIPKELRDAAVADAATAKEELCDQDDFLVEEERYWKRHICLDLNPDPSSSLEHKESVIEEQLKKMKSSRIAELRISADPKVHSWTLGILLSKLKGFGLDRLHIKDIGLASPKQLKELCDALQDLGLQAVIYQAGSKIALGKCAEIAYITFKGRKIEKTFYVSGFVDEDEVVNPKWKTPLRVCILNDAEGISKALSILKLKKYSKLFRILELRSREDSSEAKPINITNDVRGLNNIEELHVFTPCFVELWTLGKLREATILVNSETIDFYDSAQLRMIDEKGVLKRLKFLIDKQLSDHEEGDRKLAEFRKLIETTEVSFSTEVVESSWSFDPVVFKENTHDILHSALILSDKKLKNCVEDMFPHFNINSRNAERETLLHICARRNLGETAFFLLLNGADPNALDDDDMTPLHVAAMYGFEYVAKLLLRNGAKIDLQDGIRDFTPLQVAASEGHVRTVQLLVKEETSIDSIDKAFDCAEEPKTEAFLKCLTTSFLRV